MTQNGLAAYGSKLKREFQLIDWVLNEQLPVGVVIAIKPGAYRIHRCPGINPLG